jgi:MFS family permease
MGQRQVGDSRRKPIILMALITAVSLFGDSMLYIALPLHWKEVGLTSLVEVGILLSANRFIRLPLNPLISWLYTKMSIRFGLTIAVIIAGTTTVLYGWAQGFVFWFILRCIWGLAWSIIRLGAYLMILESSTNENRGHFMGTFNGLSRIGNLVGMLAGGFFIEWFGIRDVTAVFGVLAFMVLPVVFQIPNSKNRTVSESSKLTRSFLIKQPMLMWMLLTVFLVMLSLEGMITATLSHLIDVRQSKMSLYGVIMSAAALAGILQASRLVISVFLSPWVGKRSDGKWGRRPFLTIALLLASVFVSIVQFDLPLVIWLLNLLALLLTSSILFVVMDAFTSDIVTAKMKAATITLYVIVSDIGAAFGPVLGYLSERSLGLSTTYWISAAVLFLLSVRWTFSAKMKSTTIVPIAQQF